MTLKWLNLTGGTAKNSLGSGDGGSIHAYRAELHISDCIFYKNKTKYHVQILISHTTYKKRVRSVLNYPNEIESEKYISIETYKKDGTPVQTPVWFVVKNNLIYIVTREKTGKVKRIRNNKSNLM